MKNGSSRMKNPERFSIYWFDPEPMIGAEIRKVRPCVVLSPNMMNQAVETVLIAPLTSSKKAWPFRITVKIMGRQSNVAFDQIRSVDSSRLKGYVAALSLDEIKMTTHLLQQLFAA